ncbi:type I polyketide synthase [Microbispora triticiradicis]|uniref:type I polyketide synthase n=1 Tax=Microbispora triticiradicis TaxID=2200763 RepID=UPI001AD7D654|nr:type I polyketide synthase [Microbispora triticiradicis]MBO4270226.1 SDR family NAD(P)-dependent oxidoreductase [Microbispora triticiradicis]
MSSNHETRSAPEPIAIVGMACRLPGARSPEQLWELLCRGENTISEIPADRFPVEEVYAPASGTPGKLASRYGGFVSGIDEFDAEFFGISPREAAATDPQHRQVMEVAWEAFEDAGLVLERMPETTGAVFLGVITSDYWDRQSGVLEELDVHTVAGSTRGGNAGRISYALNLTGMSLALDAACSSSLAAVQLAVQSLRAGACDLAFAGGVNAILTPDHGIGFSQGAMMALDGQCKAFDARADGYVRSEGVGVVVLKTLSRALADGDRIHALIRGAAASNDGHSDGFMAPQVPGQQAALRAAYRDAGVDPASVAYVEAHGTGTRVGDPVEIAALAGVLGQGRPADRPLLVGSVKTNVGHTEGAAGVTGLIKAALCVKHGWLPASLNFTTPNPSVPWDEIGVRVCDRGQPWPQESRPRRAGVSSFGVTGTNAHIVLEEPPAAAQPDDSREDRGRTMLLPISARTPGALTALAARYADLLRTTPLRQVAAAAGVRRSHHDLRLAVVAGTAEEAVATLDAYAANGHAEGVHRGEADDLARTGRTAWVFPGQGAQWAGMARDLLGEEPVFAEAIADCENAMRRYVDWSLTAELTAEPEASRLAEIDVAQPAIFAVQVALARLWRSWGFEPDAVIGHSMGEVAAAHVAGVLDLDDAARIICGRSQLIRATSGRGAMAAVELSPERAEALIAERGGRAVLAVHNGPASCVLAGAPEEIDAILRDLDAEGVFGRRVQVDIASHSPQMDPLREPLLELLAPLRPRQGDVPLISTVTGGFVDGSRMNGAYWVDNLREPVLFADAVQHLAGSGFDTFVEFSPNPLLARAVQQNLRHAGGDGVVVTALTRDTPGRAALLEAAAELYVNGRAVDFSRLQPHRGHHVPLPSYPWQHTRYWKDPVRRPGVVRDGGGHPIIGAALTLAPAGTLVWDFDLDTERLPYLNHHQVHDMPMLSGSAFHELALAAGEEAYRGRTFAVEDLRIERAVFLQADVPQRLQARLDPAGADRTRRWTCYLADTTGETTEWSPVATALVSSTDSPEDAPWAGRPDLTCYPRTVDVGEHYAALRRRGIQQTGPFQAIAALHRAEAAVAAELRLDASITAGLDRYTFHPALLDAALQPVMALLDDAGGAHHTYLPVRTTRCRVHRRLWTGTRLWSTAVRISPADDPGLVEFDVLVKDDKGRVVASVDGFQIRRLDEEPPEVTEQKAARLLYGVEWAELDPLPAPAPRHAPWLVVSDSPVGAELCDSLAAAGGEPLLVQPGAGYQRLSPGRCVLDPASAQDWTMLIKEETARGAWPPRAVVRLSAPHSGEGATGPKALTGPYEVLTLVKALTSDPQAAPRLWLVTTAAQAPDGIGDVDPTQTAVWGLGRVIPYEHSELRCSLIDLPGNPDSGVLRALSAEIRNDGIETEIALRAGRRYAGRLSRRPLPPARPVPVGPDATYLIAGGCGGVGLLTAEWLVRNGARHLVLVGRSGAPESAAEQIAAMRSAGANVHVAAADIASREAVAELLNRIARDMPPLRGVVNSAVVLDDGTLAQLDHARFFAPMSPKVDGSWNLHELTRHLPLDFFLMYSSAASVIGSPGQGNYSAANGYQDGLAWHRQACGLPALTVNWGQWAATGQVAKANKDLRLNERGFAGFAPAEAQAVLCRLLSSPHAQASVMSFDPTAWTHYFPALRTSSLLRHLVQDESPDASADDLDRAALACLGEEEAGQLIAAYLCRQVAAVVQLPEEKVDPAQRPHRLGLDSLMAVQLRNRIAADLQINVPVAVFLQRRTIGDLATFALAHLRESAVTTHSSDPAGPGR